MKTYNDGKVQNQKRMTYEFKQKIPRRQLLKRDFKCAVYTKHTRCMCSLAKGSLPLYFWCSKSSSIFCLFLEAPT